MLTRLTALAALSLTTALAAPLWADAPFTGVQPDFAARFMAMGADRGPVLAGSKVTVQARDLVPGQKVSLRQNGAEIGSGTVDEKGGLAITLTLPAAATPGVYPVVAELSGPDYATTFDLKVSQALPESGAVRVTSAPVVPGLYQVAYAPDLNALYVTSAVGRPPVKDSALVKLDPATLKITAQVSPDSAGDKGGVFAVYGVGLDTAAGQVWTTNTRQDTVAVYDAGDLHLLKQFPAESVPHPRDVVTYDGKAYVSAAMSPDIYVFDAATLEPAGMIELKSGQRGGNFGAASMALDAKNGTLVVASMSTDEVALVDLKTGAQTATWPVKGSKSTIGVAYAPEAGLIFTAGQGNDMVSVLDAATGAVKAQVNVGANPLNVTWDPVSKLAWVAVRGAGTLVAVSPEGRIVADKDIGSFPNHLVPDGKGGVYMVNKSMGENDESGDRISHVSLAE